MKRPLEALYPTESEIRLLACRETDPRNRARFTPFVAGPFVAVAGLLAIGLAAIVISPLRLYRMFLK